jgi:hypothetical protein
VDAGLAEGHRVALVRHVVLDPAVEVLVLEVEDGVRILDGLDEETLRVGGGRRADHLQTRDVREARLGVLGMERAAREASARGEANRDRHRGAGSVALLGGDGYEVVPRARDEVRELHLRDRAHAHDGGSGAAAHDRGLGERRVDHAPGAELLLESLSDLERTAVDTDVLADHEDALVALHLLTETVGDRLQVRFDGHQRQRLPR